MRLPSAIAVENAHRSSLVDPRPVLFMLGCLLDALGASMIIPALVDLASASPDWKVFAASAAVTIFVGTSLVLMNMSAPIKLNLQQGAMLTVCSWLVIALFSALPLCFAGIGLSFTDGFFEAMSGLTTTGSTVIEGLDNLPPGLLLWRGILQWLGGIGIIVMGIAIFPFLRVGGMQLFRNESSDRSDRPVPRFQRFILAILLIYVALTFVCTVLLMLSGFKLLDAVTHAMTTLSTGGFSTSDKSVAGFANPAAEWIITVFMVIGALPFALYVLALQGNPRRALQDTQMRSLIVFLVLVIGIVTVWLWWSGRVPFSDALRLAAFNLVSIATTTGFATTDYMQWGPLPVAIFFFLTFVGGCTGSTSGGIKIYRFQLFWIMLQSHIGRLVHPHSVRPTRYAGRPVSNDVLFGGMLYICLFLITVAVTALILETMALDLVTAVTAAATAVANVGPGLGNIIGPAGNFSSLPDGAKWVLSIAMLLGRLEIFTMILLVSPIFWRN